MRTPWSSGVKSKGAPFAEGKISGLMSASDYLLVKHLLSELRRWPRSFDQSVSLQVRQVRRLLQHAEEQVPFYRRAYREAGFSASQFASLEDMRKIPLTSREQRQALPEEELLASSAHRAKLIVKRTSGSSGRPLNVLRSRLELAVCQFVNWQMHKEIGTRMRDGRVSVALLRGQVKQRWHRRFGIFPMDWLDVRLPVQEIVTRLCETKPDILICPSSTAAWLANGMTPENRRVFHPRIVLTWGDTISEEMRNEIREAFQAKVVDFYGSHETRMIAVQCPETGLYHLFENMTAVEVLRDGEPAEEGQEGEVVVTPLWSYAMPIIRYRQGDIVKLGPKPCPCGASVRTLAGIQGRVLDMIPIPGGGEIHPYNLIRPVVSEMKWVRRFQFVQESPRALRLLLVPAERPSNEQVTSAVGALESRLSGQMEIRAELVEEIPVPPGGKYCPYLSLQRQESWRKSKRD